ncbi:MAG: E3 ubiquitin ligase family protein [candidate division Zixibacteria bacterium]|nr:E3 ubiquitin ligase family protein [candidate division Zixibacteria bacterium]
MAGPGAYIAAVVFTLAGAVALYLGFNSLHKYRMVKDIPTSRIRALAMGLVEIKGKVSTERFITAPFSGTACVYYRYVTQKYESSQGGSRKGGMKTLATGDKAIPFFLEDDTGAVKVDPAEAQFAITRVRKVFHQKPGDVASLSERIAKLKELKSQGKFKDPGIPLDIPRNLIPVEPGASLPHSGRIFSEFLILPGDELYVMGTAAGGTGAPDNVVIRKGRNDPVFMISDNNEKQCVHRLKSGAVGGFAAGALCFTVGVVLLLHFAGVI